MVSTSVVEEGTRTSFAFTHDYVLHVLLWTALFLFMRKVLIGEWLQSHERSTGGNDLDQIATDHLAELKRRAVELLKHIHGLYMNEDGTLRARAMVTRTGVPRRDLDDGGSDGVDITCAVVRLLEKHLRHPHYPNAYLQVTEYDNDDDDVLAVNQEKGRHLKICVYRKGQRKDGAAPEKMNVLMRVLLHELAHSMHCEYVHSRNHGRHFKRLETYLLHEARSVGVYQCPQQEGNDSLRVCGRLLPLSALCRQSRGTQRKPSAVAEAQDGRQCPPSRYPHRRSCSGVQGSAVGGTGLWDAVKSVIL